MGILDNKKNTGKDTDTPTKKVEETPVKEKAVVKKDAKKAKSAAGTEKGTKKDAYRVLVRPLITEKSAMDSQLFGKYYFEVFKDANKIMVADAVKALYGVSPKSVNVVNVKPRNVRFGRRRGTQKGWKKAIVTLKKGETISFETV